jgi:uncharacterized protein YecE (DUF72 family)
MDIWIGTSGYSYTGWVGDFYPAGLSSKRMLAYYASQFPLVELNFTFYRPPTAEMLARIGDQTPNGFQFLVKVPQSVSHQQSRVDLPGFRRAVEQLQSRGKLLGLLTQLPQATHDTPKDRAWIKYLAGQLGDLRLAVEFRHRSWSRGEVPLWLADLGLDLVAVDVPKLSGLYPSGWVQSSSTAYVRLHSRTADNWYSENGERYDYDYSENELREWVNAALDNEPFTDRVLLLFNNCQRSQAALNARRMRELFLSRGTNVNVIAPFAPVPPVQQLLFR